MVSLLSLLQRRKFLMRAITERSLAVLQLCNSEPALADLFFFSPCRQSPDHEKHASVFLPGSAAALVRPEPEEQPRSGQTWRRRTEGLAGCRHPEPQRRVELIAPIRAQHCAAASASPAPSFPGAKESPAGVPLRPVPRRSHQHPQCPHWPGQEPGHENQGSSQRRIDGTNRQEEIRSVAPGSCRGLEGQNLTSQRTSLLTWWHWHLVRNNVSSGEVTAVSICPLELRSEWLYYLILHSNHSMDWLLKQWSNWKEWCKTWTERQCKQWQTM